jgi:hypothetical protein
MSVHMVWKGVSGYIPMSSQHTDLEWDTRRGIIRNYFGNHEHVAISILALMKSKAPVRLHNRLASDLRILHTDVFGAWPCEEVQIDDATKSVVLEILSVGIVYLDVHSA